MSQSPSIALSAHQVRQHQREVQSAIRVARNDVNRNLDAWKAAIDHGRATALALCNSLLFARQLEAMPLGELPELMPDLIRATHAKLEQQALELLQSMKSAVGSLQSAADGFSVACNQLAMLVAWQQDHRQLLLSPVFKIMTLTEIYESLQSICAMHGPELAVKRGACLELHRLAEEVQETVQGGPPVRVPTRQKTVPARPISCQDIENRTQALVSTWMLPVLVDDQRVQRELDSLSAELAGC